MTTFKAYILYVVITWQMPPLVENQKTLVLQFNSLKECRSIAKQATDLAQKHQAPFTFKLIECMPCNRLYEDKRCPPKIIPKVVPKNETNEKKK